MIITKITDLIGTTPLLELACTSNAWKLYLKLEKFNPGGSMKDRMARGMIDDAEKRGSLEQGGVIVESSSGNTGTGLAMVAAERGYRFIVVVDHHAATDKIRSMEAMGAEIIQVGDGASPDKVATAEREALAERLAAEIPGAVVLRQHRNASNAASYVDTLASDLVKSVPNINILIGSVGTGGSLCGTARGVRAHYPDVHVIGVEPMGSIIFGGEGGDYFQSGTGVPPNVEIGTVIDFNTIDCGMTVDDIAAFNTCRFMASRFGLLVGGSAGAIIYAAARELKNLKGSGSMVAIIGDGGEKYLDTIFNDQWLQKNKLFNRSVDADLAEVLTSCYSQEHVS